MIMNESSLFIKSQLNIFFFAHANKKVQQRGTQDQIAYFGQTPSQLLTVPHLKKMPLSEVLHLQVIFYPYWLNKFH